MNDKRHRGRSRRQLLAVGGAVGLSSLAGCTGTLLGDSDDTGSDTDADAEDDSDSMAEEDTDSGMDEPLGGHPAAAGLHEQPRFGPSPTEAEGVVIAFEDPSCPRCAAFETGTVPKLREQHSDSVTFVFRNYPVVYPWGEPASQAIEAAFGREMEMMDETTESDTENELNSMPYGVRQGSVDTWALVRHYFETQDQFNTDNVFERTRTFLADETDLDADAVVEDAKAEEYGDVVQADLDAGEAADAGQTTPSVFLFSDGEFQTKATGSVSYQVISSALEL